MPLFPAYAGVILSGRDAVKVERSFPRIRGGDPTYVFILKTLLDFSPHTRG